MTHQPKESSNPAGDGAASRASAPGPQLFNAPEPCVDAIIERTNKHIVLGLPLGLGKANHIANELYRRASEDPSIRLEIFTALTLEIPKAGAGLQARLLEPLNDRLFAGYPELLYVDAQRHNRLPPNVTVKEFFFLTAANLSSPAAQQSYVSSNYTHAIRDLVDQGVNVIAQLIAAEDERFSLSCNTDITLQLLQKRAQQPDKVQFMLVGQVNSNLPFMPNDAEIDAAEIDLLVQGKDYDFPLFAAPNRAVSLADYTMALQVSTLIKDGGTLQIGIGALGDAVAYLLGVRQQNNEEYIKLSADVDSIIRREQPPVQSGMFAEGLYGCSEMLVYGFLHLRKCGVLSRKVYADLAIQKYANEGLHQGRPTPELLRVLLTRQHIDSKLSAAQFEWLQATGMLRAGLTLQGDSISTPDNSIIDNNLDNAENFQRLCELGLADRFDAAFYLHGGFFLGSSNLYQTLQRMPAQEKAGINMTSVAYVNQLYGNEELKRLQRVHGRFVNTALMATLTGAVISDGLKDAQVLSGVGGQYNFVAMAHELDNAHSIIVVPSTRQHKGRARSNIVWEYPHCTIPRHLRDIVVTEYGVADLRGKSDRDVICAMLAICDSRFQKDLLKQAKQARKIEADYTIPAAYQRNLPAAIDKLFHKKKRQLLFPHFPFGTDLSTEEAELGLALVVLKDSQGNKWAMFGWFVRGALTPGLQKKFANHLARMQLVAVQGFRQRIMRRLLLVALATVTHTSRPLWPDANSDQSD